MSEQKPASSLDAYRISQLEHSVSSLREANTILAAEWREESRALHQEITDMKSAEAAKERQLLLVGITNLGGIVTTLFGVLWAYRSVIFK